MQSEFRKAVVGVIPDLKRFALSLTRDDDLADDLLSLTLVRCLDAEPSIGNFQSIKALTFKIMFNQWRNERKSLVRRERLFKPGSDDVEFAVEARLDDLVDLGTAYMAVDRLEEPYKTAIMLVAYDGMSYNEISDIMSAPEGTVRSWVFRARGMVRQMLETAPVANMRGPRI